MKCNLFDLNLNLIIKLLDEESKFILFKFLINNYNK